MRPVTFDTLFAGRGPGANGAERVAFSASTRISRKDFGMTYNPIAEAGGIIAGDEVRINLELECTKFARVTQTEAEWAAIEAVKRAEIELDAANVTQDAAELTRLLAADLVYYGGDGASQTRSEWISSLKVRSSDNGRLAAERVTQRAKEQNRPTLLLMTGLRVGHELEYEIEYHGPIILTNKVYTIQDAVPGQPLQPGPERCLRYARAWRLEDGQWRLFSHRYIHAID